MPTLATISHTFRDISVTPDATFADAARAMREHRLPAIAVVGGDGSVRGMFTEDDLIRGLFPAYLGELRHSAFIEDDLEALGSRVRRVAAEPVSDHMRDAVTLDVTTSVSHAAERFLHCEWGALAVVADHRFVGMLSESEFAKAMCERLGLA